jgi:GT2 family glycosyltransferase
VSARDSGVAVIIPLFDGADWIAQTLDSVRAQELPPREIVVVDDGSSDAGPTIVRERGVRLIRNPRRGSVAARNLGFAVTSAPLVAFLDQDDFWHPAHLTCGAELLGAHPDVVATLASTTWFSDPPPALDGEDGEPEASALWERFPFRLNVATPSAALVRRSRLAAAGGWDERFTGVADTHLWLRLETRGPILRSGACTVAKRVHERSMMTANKRQLPAWIDLRRRSMRAALDDRLSFRCSREESRRLESRFEALAPADEIAKLGFRESWTEVAKPARALDAALSGSPRERIRAALKYIGGILAPTGARATHLANRRAILRRFLEAWPGEAEATKRELAILAAEAL